MKEIKSTSQGNTTVDKQSTVTHPDTHPDTHQVTHPDNQITTPDGKPVVSLNDLKAVMPDIRRVKTPTAKELRALQPILEQPLDDGGLWVYSNGFALYQSGKRTSVLRVTRASSHTYVFADGEKTISLNDQPWATALAIYGEGRIEQNAREWDERRNLSYDGFDDSEDDEEAEGIELVAADDVEGAVVKKLSGDMERMLGQLTVRQRQVVQMYYFEELTQQEVADRLGIGQRAVSYALGEAAARLKKTFRNF